MWLTVPLNLPAPGRSQSVYILLQVWHGPVFLVNSRLGLVSATLNAFNANSLIRFRSPLSRSYGGYFAEFLHHDSLDRLSILYLSTCVGLGYGAAHNSANEAFLGMHRITQPNPSKGLGPSCLRHPGCRIYLHPPYTLSLRSTKTKDELPSCVPPQLAYLHNRTQTQP